VRLLINSEEGEATRIRFHLGLREGTIVGSVVEILNKIEAHGEEDGTEEEMMKSDLVVIVKMKDLVELMKLQSGDNHAHLVELKESVDQLTDIRDTIQELEVEDMIHIREEDMIQTEDLAILIDLQTVLIDLQIALIDLQTALNDLGETILPRVALMIVSDLALMIVVVMTVTLRDETM